jgi:hypothetical protein
MNETRKRQIITMLVLGVFLWLIYFEYTHHIEEYIADTLIFMGVTIAFHIFYKKLNLDLPSYLFLLLAMLLHNAGAFGWYNISPLPMQWDHITHLFGSIGPTLAIFRWCGQGMTRKSMLYTTIIILLATMGVGAIVELYEFAGYLTVGEGVGGLGQGEGDLTTEIGEGPWLNTMLDIVFNLLGTIIGIGIGYALKYHQQI